MSIFIWIPFAAAAAALIWWRPRRFVTIALVLTALDLARAGMGQNPAIPVAHAKTPFTPAMAAMRDDRFVGTGPGPIPPLTANVGMRYGLRDGRGYDYPTEKRYDALWRRAVVKPDPLGLTLPSTQTTTTPAALHAMGLLAVKWIFSPDPAPAARGLPRAGRPRLREPVRGPADVRRRLGAEHRRPARPRDPPRVRPAGDRRGVRAARSSTAPAPRGSPATTPST